MARATSELMDHFLEVERTKEVLAVGLGTAGCRILSYIKKEKTAIDRFLAISTDEDDIKALNDCETLLIPYQSVGKISPRYVRAVALNHAEKIRALIGQPNFTFILAGLGGGVGSALAPVVANFTKNAGSFSIAVAVMPFEFEKRKHFYAGIALRRLRRSADAVIVVDNESFLKDMPHMPMLDMLAAINEKISFALETIISYSSEKHFSVGLKKLAHVIQENGFSILSVYSPASPYDKALAGVVLPVYRIAEPREASRAIIHLTGDAQPSAGDVAASVKRLNDLMGSQLEIHYGFTTSTGSTPTAVLVVSGFSTTKFDEYDPLWPLFDEKGNNLDELPELTLNVDFDYLASIE